MHKKHISPNTTKYMGRREYIFCYFQRTVDLDLFYLTKSQHELLNCADIGYLSNPHKARSQIEYLFTCGGATISWRFTKQSIATTSSNHTEIMTINDINRECVWLK